MKKLRMVMEVVYNDNGVPVGDLKRGMEQVIQIGMGDGIFTGESDAEIEDWKLRVEEKVLATHDYTGENCPNCGDENIIGEKFVPEEATTAYRNCNCKGCGASWTEELEMTGFNNLYLKGSDTPVEGTE